MNIKHNDLVIPPGNPFEHCKLDRKKYADVLTTIVGTYADGFVLAINNEWGTGKTTFVKMWEQQLKNQGYRTLYFNAWENDFDVNPIAAVLGELKKLLPKGNKQGFKSLLQKGAVIAKNVMPAVAKGIAKKYIDIDVVVDSIESASKAGFEILKEEVDNYAKKQKGITDFRKELEKFVAKGDNSKPLVFIIDELDRCRPNYAVEVLEKMKHFFTVPGIVFVLSIDKTQLGNAIRGVYGSEQIDANEYLRRFIDIEYSIPTPSIPDYCNYLFEYYDFKRFFNSSDRNYIKYFKTDSQSFLDFSAILFEDKNLTLRQIDKLFSHARAALNLFPIHNFVFPSSYLFLIYLKNYNAILYEQIKSRKLDMQGFIDSIGIIFPQNNPTEYYNYYIKIEALLIKSYFNFYKELFHDTFLTKRTATDEKITLFVNSSIRVENANSLLLQHLEAFKLEDFDSFRIDFLLNKIDLLENINN